jgi:hypothetical protein
MFKEVMKDLWLARISSLRNDGSKCVVLGYNSTYFSNKIQKGKTCYSTEQECAAIYQLLLHMV